MTADEFVSGQISYLPFSYFSALSWNNTAEKQRDFIYDYLNKYIFKDESNRFAQLMADAGRYQSKFDL